MPKSSHPFLHCSGFFALLPATAAGWGAVVGGVASDATLARAQGLGFALGSLFLSQPGRSARSFGMEDGKIEKVLPFFLV